MVSLTYYLTSSCLQIIETYLQTLNISLDMDNIKVENLRNPSRECYYYKVHSVEKEDYLDCDEVQKDFLTTIKKEWTIAQCREIHGLRPILTFTFGTINQEDSTPPLTLRRPLISFCEQIGADVWIDLRFHYLNEYDGQPHAGVYYRACPPKEEAWCMSDMENVGGIDTDAAESIRKSGGDIFYGESFHHMWAVDVHFENSFPEKPINEFMTLIRYPGNLGQYCAIRGLRSHVDITHYGIYSPRVHIIIPSEFFVFCSKLQVEWIDVDIMI